MRKIVFILIVALSTSCSLKDPKEHSPKLKINIQKEDTENLSQMIMPSIFTTSEDPTGISDFNCFAVNVTGSGILSNNRLNQCSVLDDMHGAGVGSVSNMFPNGSIIELDVQPGLDRRIDVYGVYPTTSSCQDNDQIADEVKGYYLGGTVTNLLGDTSINVQAAYTPTNPNKSVVCIHDLYMRLGASSPHLAYKGTSASTASITAFFPPSGYADVSTNSNLFNQDGQTLTVAGVNTYYSYFQFHFNVTNVDFARFSTVEFGYNGYSEYSNPIIVDIKGYGSYSPYSTIPLSAINYYTSGGSTYIVASVYLSNAYEGLTLDYAYLKLRK